MDNNQWKKMVDASSINESDRTTADKEHSPSLQQGDDKKLYTLLLVEDTFTNQKLGQIILTRLGYEVELAVNGLQAIQMCMRKKYDMILMDCQMPIMDGYEATNEIRNDSLNRYTVIIAMTAHVMEGDREKCLLAGMNDYISKPISITNLDQITQKWLKETGGNNSEESIC